MNRVFTFDNLFIKSILWFVSFLCSSTYINLYLSWNNFKLWEMMRLLAHMSLFFSFSRTEATKIETTLIACLLLRYTRYNNLISVIVSNWYNLSMFILKEGIYSGFMRDSSYYLKVQLTNEKGKMKATWITSYE